MPVLALPLVAPIAGCGGGGGAAPTSAGGELNEGSYSVTDFDYVDAHPPGYHPLGRDGFQVLRRDELLAIVPGPDGESRSFRLQEDPAAGHAEVIGFADLFAGEDVHAAAGGELDGDAASELVVATVDAAGSRITLHRVDRSPVGTLERTPLSSLDAGGWSFADVRLVLADVDGDLRDEIVVTARSAAFRAPATRGGVWVLDDPQDGGGELLAWERIGRHTDLQALPLDADGDGDAELAVGLSGDTTDDGRYPVRLYDLAAGELAMSLVHGWHYLHAASDMENSRVVVGDFDGNGREDLAWVGLEWGTFWKLRIKLFERAPEGSPWQEYAAFSLIDVSPPPVYPPQYWDLVAFCPAVGRSDLALATLDGGDFDYTALHHDRTLGRWSTLRARIDVPATPRGITLAASDVDADGVEEVQVAVPYTSSGGAYPSWLGLGVLEHGDAAELAWQDPVPLPSTGSSPPATVPVLAAADIDADGFAVQSTGRRQARLADPIPLVVLSAPPTVSGISQNYGDTESAYSTGTTTGTSIGVTSYTSVTYSGGGSVDLFGVLGVEGRASLEKGVERTQTSTTSETVVQGYRGSSDADVIVFQGTLYETYEYVIVGASDADAIGTYLTLDVPVDANTYKWTVEYYNSQVPPEDRIGPDVLTHTPGGAASYPSRAELADLLAGELHWDLQASRPVGQGNASDFQSVSFAEESATEEQRTVQKGYGGGLSFGISVDADRADAEGSTHGVVYGSETSFEATVGDIADPEEYEAWRYNWGFSIQTVGRQADADNAPTGWAGSKHGYQYLRYWVEPTGSAW